MYEKDFLNRLVSLREEKGVSAREMSLAIGQNPGYINNIESGKTLPSMTGFFFICEYLDISPTDFFDFENKKPHKNEILIQYLNKLNDEQINCLITIIKNLSEK